MILHTLKEGNLSFGVIAGILFYGLGDFLVGRAETKPFRDLFITDPLHTLSLFIDAARQKAFYLFFQTVLKAPRAENPRKR